MIGATDITTRSGPRGVLRGNSAFRLPALVLLVLATATALLQLPPADQAQAQPDPEIVTTVWSATLTAASRPRTGPALGCDNTYALMAACSDSAVLTDNDFVYGGTTYTINVLFWDSDKNRLFIAFEGLTHRKSQAALRLLKLHVGDDEVLRIRDAKLNVGEDMLRWDVDVDWAAGDAVELEFTNVDTFCGIAENRHAKLRADCVALLAAKPRLVPAPLPWVPQNQAEQDAWEEARRKNKALLAAVNWRTSVPVKDWDGITVGRVNGKKRITKIEMPAPAGGPTLFGIVPEELGQLTGLRVINFTDQQLRGPIPAEIGSLRRLSTLFLAGNRLSANRPSHVLPEFQHPEVMERIRLTPNGWDRDQSDSRELPDKAKHSPFDYDDGNGNVTRSCVPAVWVDYDADNDNLTKWSRRNLMGSKMWKDFYKAAGERDGTLEPRFQACT